MKLKVETTGVITGFTAIGAASDMNVTVDDDTVPVDFSTNFSDDGRWLYKDNKIVKNPDYVVPDTPKPVPTAEQQLVMQQAADIAQMKQMIMSQASQIAILSKGSAK
ncbi:DUF2977 domain-containing protein [Lactiplantibacillus plantarum]|uniref:DUF2977 domain-containing protein n=1 Tax=Lactiplantibacillus plantarum TaxID=1590 RepID=UPI0007B548F0|nr:DUF2977 domain-containing protein [Lactiplantibacillus plantarum]KZU71694.1 hypothetical protein Nizo2889_2381 [Lactiplantibacillus plantarum]